MVSSVVMNDLFEKLHYSDIELLEDGTVQATNPLGEQRVFEVKRLEGAKKSYFIHANRLSFLVVELMDDIYPIEFELEVDGFTVNFRDYYYQLTDEEKQKLTDLYK
ncbi:hypothetical protein [Turicibacter sp.]|uniref:hypothetical protein n=1 Tax=Turicibacter sp. TaxID=2049042 RepID=UPI001B6FFE18|nr:hypothetical protein [Turicibacter sp.]MBP3902865.1 hypothetical protein [Turicibacter sp.]